MAKKNKEKLKQVGAFILDKSGSMETLRKSAISGFNEYIHTLKEKKVDVDFTLALFDTMSTDVPYDGVSISKVEPLSESTYRPMGGTPLYDAAVDIIEKLEHKVKHMDKRVAVSVVIMTDGEENSSTRHDQKCLRELVDKLTKQGNWTFAYMGANQDAWANAAAMGISAGNVMAWTASSAGSAKAFRSLANASAQYAETMMVNDTKGLNLSSAAFFAGNKGGDK